MTASERAAGELVADVDTLAVAIRSDRLNLGGFMTPRELAEALVAAGFGRIDAARREIAEAERRGAERVLDLIESLADEWDGTVYKLPPGYPMTVNEFCCYWFKAPLRDFLAGARGAAR